MTFERGSLVANGVALWLDESGGDDDSFLAGGPGWVAAGAERRNARLLAGLGYYNAIDARGEAPFFDGNPRRNSVDPNGNYLFGFEIVEAFAEYSFEAGDVPITLFADIVQNQDADRLDTGYALGVKLRFPGDRPWGLGYTYQDLEANAVLGILTNSDFGGGGTDVKGHLIKGNFDLSKKSQSEGNVVSQRSQCRHRRGGRFRAAPARRELQVLASVASLAASPFPRHIRARSRRVDVRVFYTKTPLPPKRQPFFHVPKLPAANRLNWLRSFPWRIFCLFFVKEVSKTSNHRHRDVTTANYRTRVWSDRAGQSLSARSNARCSNTGTPIMIDSTRLLAALALTRQLGNRHESVGLGRRQKIQPRASLNGSECSTVRGVRPIERAAAPVRTLGNTCSNRRSGISTDG